MKVDKLLLLNNGVNLNQLQLELNEELEKAEETEGSAAQAEAGSNAPESKPVTTSLSDVVKFLKQNGASPLVMSGTSNIPEGVSEYACAGQKVTVYKRNTLLKAQIVGVNSDGTLTSVTKFLPQLEEVLQEDKPADELETKGEETESTSGVNGEIDEKVAQGGTGDCWIIAGVLSLACSELGQDIIKSAITANPDGSVTVEFKGVGASYTISADEIGRHDTDDIAGDAYSNGDNDMLVIELAVEKLVKDIANNKVVLNIPTEAFESYNTGNIEGGFASQLVYFFTGELSDTYLSENPRAPRQVNFTEAEIYQIFQDALEKGNTSISFGIYDGTHTAQLTNGETYRLALGNGGHALAITNLTEDTVTFVNPWDSTVEYTMTWSEFAKLGVGLISVTDLSNVEVPKDEEVAPVDPVEPDVPSSPVYTSEDLINQGFTQEQLDQYFDKTDNGYVMKDGITFKKQEGQYNNVNTVEIEITSLEMLKEYCGANQRLELKEQGFTDELINKYFILAVNAGTGKAVYGLHPLNYAGYTTAQEGENTLITITARDGSTIEITVKPDGTYTENVIENIDETPANPGVYTSEDLINQGFTQEQLDQYFNKTDNGYVMKDNISFQGLLFFDATSITTIEELREFFGANQRQELRNEGFPDELIEKYFNTHKDIKTGKISYNLDISDYTGYTTAKEGENTVITVTAKDGSSIKITVKPNGTYTETAIQNVNDDTTYDTNVYTPDELVNQGFTEDEVIQYFNKTEDGYVMRQDITFSIQVINSLHGKVTLKEIKMTSVEMLKEYCGANQRQELRDEGFTDELIEKYFSKVLNSGTGKTSYVLNEYSNYSVTKEDDDTIIEMSSRDSNEVLVITVKPDGTYTETRIDRQISVIRNTYTKESLTNQGFTQAQIDKYFEKTESGDFVMRDDIVFERGSFPKRKIEINSLSQLKEYCGANSRKKLKDEGFPDKLIDKYFGLYQQGNGKSVYKLNSEYSNYTVTQSGQNTVIIINTKDNSETIRITVKPDGSYYTVRKDNTPLDIDPAIQEFIDGPKPGNDIRKPFRSFSS